MTIPRGFGSFDPTITTKFGPTGTEEIDAINRGVQLGLQQGQQIARARQMRRREERDIAARKQLEETRAATRYNLYKEQEQGLIFPPTQNIDGINAARAEVSTMLVDKANKLFEAKEAGEITAKDYRKGMTLLESQIPMYKAAEETIRVNAEKYLAGMANGTLSNTNDPKVESWWAAVADGSAKLQYKTTEAGQIVITGEWDDPNDGVKGKVQVPVSEIERMSVVRYQPKEEVSTFKKANTDSMLTAKIQNSIANGTSKADLLRGLQDPSGSPLKIDPSDPNMQEQFGNNFDEYMEGLGEGDEVQQIAQYIMDGGKGNYLSSQNVLQNVINKIDDPTLKAKFEEMNTEGDLKELIKLGKIEEVKEGLRDQYINSSINQYNFDLTEKIKELNNVQLAEDEKTARLRKNIKDLNTPSKENQISDYDQDLSTIASNLANLYKSKAGKGVTLGGFEKGEQVKTKEQKKKDFIDQYGQKGYTFEEIQELSDLGKKRVTALKNEGLKEKDALQKVYESNQPNNFKPDLTIVPYYRGRRLNPITEKGLYTIEGINNFNKHLKVNTPKNLQNMLGQEVTSLNEDGLPIVTVTPESLNNNIE